MTVTMTKEERESFLAGVHVAIVGISVEGRGPLTTPVWYWYEPGGHVWFETEPNSIKGKLLHVWQENQAFACRMKTRPTHT